MEPEGPLFTLSVDRHDGVATVILRGELDLDGADRVRSTMADLFDQGVRIEIDAGELTFIDSSGFKALLDVRHDARRDGADIEVVAASDPLRWIVEVTGVDYLLPEAG